MITEAQRQARKAWVGASDVPAICGVSPFENAFDIWQSKIPTEVKVSPDAKRQNEMMTGHFLESGILDMYESERAPLRLVRSPDTFTRGIFGANLDGVATHAGLIQPYDIVVEIKNVSGWNAKEWAISPPEHVVLQVHAQMYCANLNECDVVALIGGTELAIFRVNFDQELWDNAERICTRFWEECVLKNIPPEDARGDQILAALKAKYAKTLGEELLEAGETETIAFRRMQELKLERQKLDLAIADCEATLLKTIQDKAGLTFADGSRYKLSNCAGMVKWKEYAISLGGDTVGAEAFRGESFRRPTVTLPKGVKP